MCPSSISDPDSVSRLVSRAQQGCPEAAERLLQISYPRLLRSARGIVRSDEAAKDVVQETLLRISQNLSALRNPDAFNGWANQVLKRCCLAHFRQEKRQRQFARDVEELSINGDESGVAESVESLDLMRAMESLGRTNQDIVKMHYFFGLSVKEIAHAVHASVGAVKVRLYRARNELRDRLVVQDNAIPRHI